jgi:hypothetical protein
MHLPFVWQERSGVNVKKEIDKNEGNQEELQQGSPAKNIARIVLLVAVLVVAWFILDKIIGP